MSMHSEPGAIMDEQLKTAMSLIKATPSNDTWWNSCSRVKNRKSKEWTSGGLETVQTVEQQNEERTRTSATHCHACT